MKWSLTLSVSKIVLISCSLFLFTKKVAAQTTGKDTLKYTGSVAVTGLVQSGDENRTVLSLLSVFKIGTRKYQVEPLMSLAYSTRPGKQVEGEYLENIIFRYRYDKKFYPAAGISFEHSLLRKINFRYRISAVLVYNIINKNGQSLKLAAGCSHEYTKFEEGAFTPPINGKNHYSRQVEQLYTGIKGENNIGKLKLIYDFFYQAAFKNLSDIRWLMIGTLDYTIAKHLSVRASALNGFENFRATAVSANNFRLTYGVNIQF